tara:strand:+ start:191 stop:1576 length:1386 start_codon:yes stop_codon:yes gene_type:complete
MSSFHIIGTGACGFLRAYQTLKNHIPLKYKGGRGKYQNSFEGWNDNGLIWDSESLSKEERLRRVSLHDTTTNITHSYLKYVPEFLELHPDMKFLCLMGDYSHSVWSLTISWGYRNPCYVKERRLGIGYNRYAVDEFPNHSDLDNEFRATEKYWHEYYDIAEEYAEKYPDNFFIVDSIKFFGELDYRTDILSKVGLTIDEPLLPVDKYRWDISTTLHGGLGNNLLQMGEVISFCKKNKLTTPFFGTWDLWDGGGKYPPPYNSDRFLGGHNGNHNIIKETFPNLEWRGDLKADYDTTFVINDMFRFSDCEELDYVREQFKITDHSEPGTASLHLRYCTQAADDHVNGYVDDSFYVECFKQIPEDIQVYIFSDDTKKAYEKLRWFEQMFPQNFNVVEADSFQSLKMMVECEYHILHVSTFSFWSAFLDINQPNNKVFYPESFIKTHSPYMIPYKEWIKISQHPS